MCNRHVICIDTSTPVGEFFGKKVEQNKIYIKKNQQIIIAIRIRTETQAPHILYTAQRTTNHIEANANAFVFATSSVFLIYHKIRAYNKNNDFFM